MIGLFPQKKRLKTIGIDIDGTIANVFEEWAKFYSLKYNKQVRLNDLNQYKIEKIFNLTRKDMLDIFTEVWKHPIKIKLVDKNIPKYINGLRKKYFISIVTASVGDLKNIKDWLSIKRINYDSFVYEASKKNMHCDILIDDRLNNILKIKEKDKLGILLHQRWSPEIYKDVDKISNVVSFTDWKSIYNYLMKL